MRRILGTAVVLAAALAMAACGEDRSDSLADATTTAPVSISTVAASDEEFPANGVSESVLALDNNYIPQVLEIAAGTEVVWDNNGRNVHDVVPADDSAVGTWGVAQADFAPEATYSYVFTKPGTYTYYCTIHGTPTAAMFGTIIVTEP
jgi:plastocyanin